MKQILTAFLILIITISVSCQTNNDVLIVDDTSHFSSKKFTFTCAVGYLASPSIGTILYYSPKIAYRISNISQINLLYRHGQSFHFSVGGAPAEWKDDIDMYNEIAPKYVLLYGDKRTFAFFGVGVGFMWGSKMGGKKYHQFALPIDVGFNFSFSESISMGFEFHATANSQTTFRGLGLNFSVNL